MAKHTPCGPAIVRHYDYPQADAQTIVKLLVKAMVKPMVSGLGMQRSTFVSLPISTITSRRCARSFSIIERWTKPTSPKECWTTYNALVKSAAAPRSCLTPCLPTRFSYMLPYSNVVSTTVWRSQPCTARSTMSRNRYSSGLSSKLRHSPGSIGRCIQTARQ